MYFYNKIKNLTDSKIIIFVDMDGVLACFDLGFPLDFGNKRPLTTNINTLKEISTIPNVELHILSICRKDYQIKEKNEWLDMYAPYFKIENRVIISKEDKPGLSSKELKCNYLKEFCKKIDGKVILIDDDNSILYFIKNHTENIILYQDSELID